MGTDHLRRSAAIGRAELGLPVYRKMSEKDTFSAAFTAARKMVNDLRSQLRHLELHAWAVRDLVREGHVRLLWVSTEDNASDLLTKAITSPSKFARFQAVILGDELPAARAELLATGQGKYVGDGKKVKCFIVCRRGCI